MKRLVRQPFCFAVETGSVFSPDKVIDGYARPFGGPRLWVSEPLAEGCEEWVEVTLPAESDVREIHLTFNDDVNEDLINL
ncbi:hypothetical protein NL455_29510, partial [Klebsiella pneumoniae]|nr:hypothetical protein [Klebsiella pneumoniae]